MNSSVYGEKNPNNFGQKQNQTSLNVATLRVRKFNLLLDQRSNTHWGKDETRFSQTSAVRAEVIVEPVIPCKSEFEGLRIFEGAVR